MVFIAEAVNNNASILEKLFTWKYFEPVLFGSIGVLLILLFIVLFLGKKDQKKKLEETKKLELSSLTDENTVDAFAEEQTPDTAVEAKVEEDIPPVVIADEAGMNMDTEVSPEDKPVELPPEEETVPDFAIFNKPEVEDDIPIPEPVTTENPNESIGYDVPLVDDVVKSSVVPEDEAIKNDIVNDEDTDAKIDNFKENFADLASSISKELDEINRMQQESSSDKVELPKEIDEVDLPKEVEVNNISEENKFAPSSIFSSVYSPNSVREEEKPVLKNEEFELPKKEELDNPFAADMPAIKEEAPAEEEKETSAVNAPDFSAFNNETFDIK